MFWFTKVPVGKALTDEQLWRDFVTFLTRNRVDWVCLPLDLYGLQVSWLAPR